MYFQDLGDVCNSEVYAILIAYSSCYYNWYKINSPGFTTTAIATPARGRDKGLTTSEKQAAL